MTDHLGTATATFSLDTWDEEPLIDAGGRTFSRATVTKTFTGDIEGTSTTWVLLSKTGEQGQEYVGLETFDVSVHGRAGQFVLVHRAAASADLVSWDVAPGSGTGELAGIAGTARIDIAADGTHTLTLEATVNGDPARA